MDTWNPSQYEKFRAEREQPYFDLLGLIRPSPAMRVVDLGCGTGKQTRVLHQRLHAARTTGIDRSPRMLQNAPTAVAGLSFREGTIEDFAEHGTDLPTERDDRPQRYDLIFSNAAFHWVENHDALIPRLAQRLKAGGQLAFQVPAMHEDPTHRAAEAVARAEPFHTALGGWVRPQPVLTVDEYARLLFRSGFEEQHVRLVVYPHVLDAPEDSVEWMKGTLVTEYERHLPPDLGPAFVKAYRMAVLERVEQTRPFFFPFRRILCWARKART